ncbi:permease prefix domain 1-containing protein [Micromonospora soli]|uniref:permease prefix domain 1-containing protein n=1 Tax=Micromonospora sp. NBRC 110009 TaxID=3061627 RepID=UPI0026726E3A|nr:permease prefix domain 1-containing protein [Micromonospora sp. NBRC 110009]WKT97654.1 permease prefix domain 1-containing protein [Micromonospora sp. NBRC 110009]
MTASNDTTRGSTTDIHRLLDQAFAGVEVTPELQDLKEEIRANLVARVADLERAGLSPTDATGRAMAELGDVRSLIDEMETGSDSPVAAWARHRVRPKPGFLVRVIVLAAIAVAALAILALAAVDVAVPEPAQLAAIVAVALPVGLIVADALRQETTTNHPMPGLRAAGYGAATTLALAGVGSGWRYLIETELPWLIGGALAVVASIVAFTCLGATQTNRHKAWVLQQHASHHDVGDRFTNDPAAAARFGLYTLTLWLIAIAAFAVLGFTIGWAWSWLSLVGGFAAMMLMLARMLFAPRD